MTQCRLLLVDDHEIVRKGLRSLLECEPDYVVVGEAANGFDAVAAAERLKPDIIIMDVTMPGLNGFEATKAITTKDPTIEVLVLTAHESDQVVREVLQAGARGYVLKSDGGKDLIAALQCLREHKPFLTSKVSNLVLDAFVGAAPDKPENVGRLTAREKQVLQALVEGQSNKEISAALAIGVKTVETHRANIMRKLGLRSVVDLVRYAIRNNLTRP